MRLQQVALGFGLVAALWLIFFSDHTSESDLAQPVVKASAPNRTTVHAAMTTATLKPQSDILALVARADLISVGHTDLNGKKTADAQIFMTQSWMPVAQTDAALKNAAPPVPVAPPLNFTYLGKKLEDGVWEVYLARGNNSYIVRTDSVIDSTYRVDAVTPTALTMTYLPLNQVQRLNIKGFD